MKCGENTGRKCSGGTVNENSHITALLRKVPPFFTNLKDF